MTTKEKCPLARAEVTGKSLIQMLADTCERIEKERDDMNQQEKETRWAASIQAAAGIIGANMSMFGFHPHETVLSEADDSQNPSDMDVAQRVVSLARWINDMADMPHLPEYPALNVESPKARSMGWRT